ncbi:hypothetical protein TB1_032335 [Malus domestica]
MPEGFDNFDHILAHSIPMILVETSRVPVRSRGPDWWDLEDSHFDFLLGHRCRQDKVFLSRHPWCQAFPKLINLARPTRLK